MMGLSGPSTAFPFLGLSLLKDPNEGCAIPACIDTQDSYGSGWRGVPRPSAVCKARETHPPIDPSTARPKLATWILSNCGRSRPSLALLRKSATQASNTRATAAIWQYGSETDDLYISWMMDDERECELAGKHAGGGQATCSPDKCAGKYTCIVRQMEICMYIDQMMSRTRRPDAGWMKFEYDWPLKRSIREQYLVRILSS